MLLALLCRLEGHLQDALNLRTRIDIGIVSLVIVLILLTEVHAARQLTDHHEIGTFQQLVLQRRLMQQTVKGSYRTHVGKQSQLLAHGEQALLGTHLCCRVVVVFQIADSGKQHGVSTHTGLVGSLRIRVAHGIDSRSAYQRLLVRELMAELLGNSIHHSNTLLHNLGTYSVARQNGNLQFHT